MKNLVFLGAPGAGKGTMAEMLVDKYGFAHISTGDILRAAIKQGTELGKEAQGYMDKGNLMPDELISAIVAEKLRDDNIQETGFILDGFPRTVKQADLLSEAKEKYSITLDAVVLIEVSREILVKRLTARRICNDCGAVFNTIFNPSEKEGVCDKCGGELYQRSDDSPETVQDRLAVYEKKTEPLIEYYDERGLLVKVSGEGTRDENMTELEKVLGL